MPGANASLPVKIGLVTSGLIGLFILFSVLKGLVVGGPNLTPLVGLAQEQQAIIHLTEASKRQKDLNVVNKNFATTAQASLTTSQTNIIKYLQLNGKKTAGKTLNAKVSTKIDEQLTAAAAAATYNQTFQDIMKTKLNTYMTDLKQAYQQTSGKKGRALLSADYNQAQLLLTQLNTPVR